MVYTECDIFIVVGIVVVHNSVKICGGELNVKIEKQKKKKKTKRKILVVKQVLEIQSKANYIIVPYRRNFLYIEIELEYSRQTYVVCRCAYLYNIKT